MTKKKLNVCLYGELVGELTQTASGEMTFTYSNQAENTISINMPIRTEPYNEVQTQAYFGGLLPESDVVRKIIAKRYGISPNNDFSLLKAIGYDCAGAISIHSDENDKTGNDFPLDAKVISEDELYNHIVELPQKPLFIDVENLRLSLAGVHDKAAVCMIENQIALPLNGCPTTHILKPSSVHFPGLVENEFFCLELARRIGLTIPKVELRQIKNINFLLIERYDRSFHNNHIQRIQQEDFCQALGVKSTRKYESEGGPSLKDCFDLLSKTELPAISRNMLMQAVVFNYLIYNMDAHSKNFSLLQTSKNKFNLAPFYDLVCTGIYEKLTKKMAMKIGKKKEVDYVKPEHWQQMCEEINFSYPAVVRIIKKQGEAIIRILNDYQSLVSNVANEHVFKEISNKLNVHIHTVLDKFK